MTIDVASIEARSRPRQRADADGPRRCPALDTVWVTVRISEATAPLAPAASARRHMGFIAPGTPLRSPNRAAGRTCRSWRLWYSYLKQAHIRALILGCDDLMP